MKGSRNGFVRTSLASAVAGVLVGGAGAAAAAGFQLQEQSASGLGVAYSGMAAAAMDASTAFWNPAGMSLLPGRQFVGALHYVLPKKTFASSGSTYDAAGSGGDAGVAALVPGLYGTWAIDPQWSAGFTINAPFGLATEWDSAWAGQFHAIRSEIKTLNLNPSVSFKLNPMVSLGAGLSYQQMKAELTNAAPGTPSGPLPGGIVGAIQNPVVATVQGDDWAWGWNLGALFDFGQGSRVGLTYRAKIRYTLEGDLSYSGAAPLAPAAQAVKAKVDLPDTASVGGAHQVNAQWRVLADYTWTGWDSIQSLDIESAASGARLSGVELRFKNSWRVGVGAEYQWSAPWLLRAGLAYDTSPVRDEFRTPRLPDSDRTWLALGVRYQPSPTMWFDAGYTYIWMKDAPSQLQPAGPVPGALNGTYRGNVQVLGVQAALRF
ncbi:MAG: outer membrane protein transport protein [Burkholderiales bacterium]|nr:outer membrane protein transport protein [Burkholderiales bacterium]